MQMTNEEIVRDYNQAANKSKQIKVLAELNCVSPGEIKAVLAQAGVAGVEAPKRLKPRKPEASASSPAGAGEARPQGSGGAAQGPGAGEARTQGFGGAAQAFAGGPEIYDRIETILAALPEDASDFARDTAKNLAIALFREDLEQRLGKAVRDDA